MFNERANNGNPRIVLTVEELRIFVEDFANADKNQKVAIVLGEDNLGGKYVGIEKVND